MGRTGGRKRIEEKHPEIIPLLGTMPDTALAKRFGTTNTTVAAARKRLNVSFHRKGEGDPDAGLVVVLTGLLLGQREGNNELLVNVLTAYDGARVYREGILDPRLTGFGAIEVPSFQTVEEACAWMREAEEKPGGVHTNPCTIPLAAARKSFPGLAFSHRSV